MEDQALNSADAFEDMIREALDVLEEHLTFAEAIGVLSIISADLAAQALEGAD